jgi:DNA transformation protein and related proteins
MGFKNTPNIGKVLEMELINSGIENEDDLKQKGAEKTFELIRRNKPDSCIDMLYALEGAVQGIRWHSLDKSRKMELKSFFDKLNK